MKNKSLLISLVFSSLPALCQLGQMPPDVCGLPNPSFSRPPGTSTIVTAPGEVDLLLDNGARRVRLEKVFANIDRMCPLPNGRLVVFAGSVVNVVDTTNGRLLDVLGAYDPVISPDQRWIVYRKYYPRGTELPASDEYLLYDLSKSPVRSHAPGAPVDDLFDVGIAIYPLGWRNESGDNIGLPDSQRHYMASFFVWSPESDAVAFGDQLLGKLSIVVISIQKNGGTTAVVHPVTDPAWCPPNFPVGDDHPQWARVQRIEFGPALTSGRGIFADIEASPSGCNTKSLQLNLNGFEAAKSEVPAIQKPTRKTIKGDGPPPRH